MTKKYTSPVLVDVTDPRTMEFGTTQNLRRIAQNERHISRNQRGEAASALDWAADRIDELEKQPDTELARLEREIATNVLWEEFDRIPISGCHWPDDNDQWYSPTEYVDAGVLAWGHGIGLLERHPEHPELVRLKENE